MKLVKLLGVLPLALGAAALHAEEACKAPGVLIAEDPTGDVANGAGGTEGTGPAFADIVSLHVAEPRELSNRMVFTLKVASLAEPLVPLHRWVVYFTLPDGVEWYAAMSTAEGPTAGFEYGTTGILDNPAAPVGQFTYVGDLDPASNFNAADGTVTLIVDTAAVGLKAGDVADFIYSKIRRSTPRPAMNMGLTLDDTGTGGFYTLGGNDHCEDGKSLLGVGALNPGALLLLALGLGLRRLRR